jgi:hypothetical protein
MSDPVDSATRRIVNEAMRLSRDNALDAAAEICDEYAKTGHGAECCARAIRLLKDMLPAAPSKGN